MRALLASLLAALACAAMAADYAVDPSVVRAGNGTVSALTAAEEIDPGEAVYKPTSTTAGLATCTNATKAAVAGIAINKAYTGQPISIVSTASRFVPGITNLTAGAILVLSKNPGAIAPSSDLASTHYPVILGVATASTNMMLDIMRGSVPLP